MRAGPEPPTLGAAAELAARAVSAQLSGPALLAAGARGLQGAGLPGPGQPGALLGRLQVSLVHSVSQTVSQRDGQSVRRNFVNFRSESHVQYIKHINMITRKSQSQTSA